ncbi:hypothetical protein Tco_1190494, partial [Tanacetum coccineum]
EPQSIFDRLMSPALDFVKQTCQQDAKRNNEMDPILQSIMQDDEEFKRGWLGIKGVGDKIFDLTPHDRVTEDLVFCENEVFGKICRHCENGDCEMSKLVEEVYLDPDSGQLFSTLPLCPGKDMLFVKRSHVQVTWLIDKHVVRKPVEYGFPSEGKYAVKWSIENDDIVVEHQLGIDLLCIKKCGSDDASVHNLVKSIRDISNANANVMKVHDVEISKPS